MSRARSRVGVGVGRARRGGVHRRRRGRAGALSRDLIDVSRARSAADAAALASVEGGPAAAIELAAANGATLVSWAQVGSDVVVEVRVGDAVATARATNVP